MPKQYTFMGRPIPQLPPRRIAQLLASVAIFAIVLLFLTLPKSIPTGPSISKFTENHHIPIPKIPTKLPPSILHPFQPSAHAPPIQEKSTSGDSSWYTHLNWLSPFSSSLTLDESRSLLPPVVARPPVYTYYDVSLKDEEIKAVENELLLTWRRAWWAQGFKPSILGPADAMRNPRYEKVQNLHLEAELKRDFSKWLAWEFMGAGVFTDYTVLPMGSYEDEVISYLRLAKVDQPLLARFENFGGALLSGSKKAIAGVLTAAMASPDLRKASDLMSVLPEVTFQVVDEPESIASYHMDILRQKYGKVHDAIIESPPKGFKLLDQLMNSHLHNTWQSVFRNGIAVLKPAPDHMSAVVEPALQLAKFLAQCPDSILPTSCPPNSAKCKTCISSIPMPITTPPHFRNTSTLFTIGTVPHPYTFAALKSMKADLGVPFIRRQTIRDSWLTTTTKEILGTGVSSAPRVLKFKEAVASPYSAARSIWFTAEQDIPTDLDWYFGFRVPQQTADNGKSETPVPGPERRPKPAKDENVDEQKLAYEKKMLQKAKVFGRSTKKEDMRLKVAIESWNLADIEAWRFASAWLARSKVEREKWEEEEVKAVGGVGAEKTGVRAKSWFG